MDVDGQFETEADAVDRARRGDGVAFRTLVEAYDRRLLYFVRRLLGDSEEAFDVVQQIWLHVHRHLRSLRTPRAFRVWLYRIAHDRAVSELRRQRRPISIDTPPLGEIPEPDPARASFETAESVHTALDKLSTDHRRVLTLHFLEGLAVDEIAEVLRCPEGTVKSRLHYAREALRREIERQ
jgi:RNA polymerase sigma-70 factor (ECF subfamily)